MSEAEEMAEAFEKSRHYFCGESPGDRAVNWLIWKDAWQAARAPQAVPALTDEQIQSMWNDACKDGPARPGWSRHIRFARAILSAPQQAVPALTDEAAMRVALRIMANLEDRKGVLDGVDDDTKADIADEIAVAILAASQPSPEPKGPEHAHDWRFSLQDHVYKCDCGATRGDYPFGAASFKD